MPREDRSPTQSGARDAFLHLVALVHSDEMRAGDESAALDDFARHLGISPRKARKYERVALRIEPRIPASESERKSLFRLLARLAYSDGRVSEPERRFLDAMGQTFRLDVILRAEILDEEERRASQHTRQQRTQLVGAGVALFLLCLLSAVTGFRDAPVAASSELGAFRAIEADYAPSVVLIHVRYALRSAEQPGVVQRGQATGTGFFVSADGHVATNKHVIQPWKYDEAAADLLATGWELDPARTELYVWSGGARVRDQAGELSSSEGYSSARGTVEVVAVAPDRMLHFDVQDASGRTWRRQRHADDNGDLAILRCRVKKPCRPLRLARDTSGVRKLDPVLVMGYPKGFAILEGGRALSEPVPGTIRKAEDTLYITNPVIGGNSGGPLIDAQGRVIGIATRTSGDATLGCCIRAEHIAALCPPGVLGPG